ncbi:regulatory protein (plasmid) [Salmonella enterica]|nr:regulatory protein [Salmonella enterica]
MVSVTGSDNGEQERERSRRLPLPVRYDEKHNIQRIFFQGIILVCGDDRKLVCGVVHDRAAAALLLTTTGPGITRPGLQGESSTNTGPVTGGNGR